MILQVKPNIYGATHVTAMRHAVAESCSAQPKVWPMAGWSPSNAIRESKPKMSETIQVLELYIYIHIPKDPVTLSNDDWGV